MSYPPSSHKKNIVNLDLLLNPGYKRLMHRLLRLEYRWRHSTFRLSTFRNRLLPLYGMTFCSNHRLLTTWTENRLAGLITRHLLDLCSTTVLMVGTLWCCPWQYVLYSRLEDAGISHSFGLLWPPASISRRSKNIIAAVLISALSTQFPMAPYSFS